MAESRTGIGFDVHPPDPDRILLLAGVHFPGEPGLAGHSDGDAACHALADALLGAAALGDIGAHFPDRDPAIAGIAGVEILARVRELLGDAGFQPAACDLVLIATGPHIAERREEMRATLAEVLRIDVASTSIKATRPEGLGLSGDGIGCLAVATVVPS